MPVTEEQQTRDVLIEACETRGKAAEIAKAFQISPSTVKRWLEGGEIPPPMVKLLRLYLLGEIPFELVHEKQDLRPVLQFTPDEWRIIETLALRGGITEAEWIRDHVRNYLNFMSSTGGVKYPSLRAIKSSKVAEDEGKGYAGA